jgi:hypothetical protein
LWTGWQNLWMGYDIITMTKDTQLSFNSCKELLYNIVQDKLNVSRDELFSVRKTRTLADTRRSMIKILKTRFPYSKVIDLGKVIARDHSSVSIQLKNHDELFEVDSEYTSLFHVINNDFNKMSYKDEESMQELYDLRDGLEEKLKIVKLIIHEFEQENTKKSLH